MTFAVCVYTIVNTDNWNSVVPATCLHARAKLHNPHFFMLPAVTERRYSHLDRHVSHEYRRQMTEYEAKRGDYAENIDSSLHSV